MNDREMMEEMVIVTLDWNTLNHTQDMYETCRQVWYEDRCWGKSQLVRHLKKYGLMVRPLVSSGVLKDLALKDLALRYLSELFEVLPP